MNVIIVDDEQIVLAVMEATVKNVMKDDNCASFSNAKDALEYAKKVSIDIAFLDINMRISNGLSLAQELKEINPKINIIFCTGHSEYTLDALNLYCSGYLLKPITEEKLRVALDNLRHPVERKKTGIFIQCFAGFEVYADSKPLEFKYNKTKEVLAFLVDRMGADCKTREITTAVFEDDDKMSYFQNLRRDLLETFASSGYPDVIRGRFGTLGIDRSKVSCDYYDYLDKKIESPLGEYMPSYEFAEFTRARLFFE